MTDRSSKRKEPNTRYPTVILPEIRHSGLKRVHTNSH